MSSSELSKLDGRRSLVAELESITNEYSSLLTPDLAAALQEHERPPSTIDSTSDDATDGPCGTVTETGADDEPPIAGVATEEASVIEVEADSNEAHRAVAISDSVQMLLPKSKRLVDEDSFVVFVQDPGPSASGKKKRKRRKSSNPRPRRVQHLGGAYQARATPRESRDCRCWRYNKSKSDNTARSKPASERHHSSRVPRKARAQPLLYLLRLQPGRLHAPDGEAARYPRVRRRHVFRCETYNRIKREQQLQPINRLKSPLYQLEHHQRSQKPQQFHKQFHAQ